MLPFETFDVIFCKPSFAMNKLPLINMPKGNLVNFFEQEKVDRFKLMIAYVNNYH